MQKEQFELYVQDALDRLPKEFKDVLTNIAILIEDEPSTEHYQAAGVTPSVFLYGLYQGVPLTKRGSALLTFPDRITIFKGPIERGHQTETAIRDQIYSTVFHEIGHYFGMTETAIRASQHAR